MWSSSETRDGPAGEDFQQFQKECLELDRQAAEIQEMKKEGQKELKDSEAMEKAHTFAVETYQQRLEEEQAEEARVQKDLEAYHLDTASIRQKTEFAAANLQRVLGELGKLRNEGEELTRSQEQAREDTRSREAGMEALRKGDGGSGAVHPEDGGEDPGASGAEGKAVNIA